MKEIAIQIFQKFAYETGILGQIRQYDKIGLSAMILIAVLALALGFKCYRAAAAALTFMAVAFLSCILLTGRADWGAIVTSFAVTGTVLAFLMYRWELVSGAAISAIVVGMATWYLSGSVFITAVFVILGVLMTWWFPVITICLLTALWGSFILTEMFFVRHELYLIPFLTLAGFILQMLTNRSQTLFQKKYPDTVRYWLEKRKGKRNADSI